jgi:hypothetical protein
MKMEGPKMPTPEEMAKMQKERILTSASLVEGGADVTPEGVILPTDEQSKDARLEMGDHFYTKYKELVKNTERTPLVGFPNGRILMEISAAITSAKDFEEAEKYIRSFDNLEQFLEEVQRRIKSDNKMGKEKKEMVVGCINEAYAIARKMNRQN